MRTPLYLQRQKSNHLYYYINIGRSTYNNCALGTSVSFEHFAQHRIIRERIILPAVPCDGIAVRTSRSYVIFDLHRNAFSYEHTPVVGPLGVYWCTSWLPITESVSDCSIYRYMRTRAIGSLVVYIGNMRIIILSNEFSF